MSLLYTSLIIRSHMQRPHHSDRRTPRSLAFLPLGTQQNKLSFFSRNSYIDVQRIQQNEPKPTTTAKHVSQFRLTQSSSPEWVSFMRINHSASMLQHNLFVNTNDANLLYTTYAIIPNEHWFNNVRPFPRLTARAIPFVKHLTHTHTHERLTSRFVTASKYFKKQIADKHKLRLLAVPPFISKLHHRAWTP